ncbi:MAG: thioester domain-containing protein [Tannerella sp.]|jgi:hypothetical protein|nr:thioester domain-containing protein [Tannerella sp.]
MKKFYLFLIVLGAGILAPAVAKATPDSAHYRVVVQYFDTIQIKYKVLHGIDDWWTTVGDIPIGVALNIGNNDSITGQLYCVDATVPFHSYSETRTTWPAGVTQDEVKDYVVAEPFELSDDVQAKLKEIQWLTIKGYTGLNLNLAAVQSTFGLALGGAIIDSTIALMATKIAIWHYANPSFTLLSTSIEDPVREQRMKDLVNLMIDSAAVRPLPAITNLGVAISTSQDVYNSGNPVGGYYYYGPFGIEDSVANEGSTPTSILKDIFLTVGGVASGDVTFVSGTTTAPSVNSPLPKAHIYGTDQDQPYIANKDTVWLKIPESRATLMGSSDAVADGLVLHAFGKATDATYINTPAILVYEHPSTGVQDWNEVQAFIGIVDGKKATLYGEAVSMLSSSANFHGSIRVSKRVENGTAADRAARYTFRLTTLIGGNSIPVKLIPNQNITGASGLTDVSIDGIFSLSDGGTVEVSHLPAGIYTLAETPDPSAYATTVKVDAADAMPGTSINFMLSAQNPSRTLTFVNRIKTPAPHPAAPFTIEYVPFEPSGGTGTPDDPYEGLIRLPCCPCPDAIKAADIVSRLPATAVFSVDSTFTVYTHAYFDLYAGETRLLYFVLNFPDNTHYYYKVWIYKAATSVPTIVRQVKLPGLEGVNSEPKPNVYTIESGTDFSFTLTPDESFPEGTKFNVTTNRLNVPANEDVLTMANGDGSYTFLIRGIRQQLEIHIEIAPSLSDSELAAGENVWTDGHTLYIRATQNGTARVYNVTGQPAATIPYAAGTTQISLPEGLYMVKTAGATYKVIAR